MSTQLYFTDTAGDYGRGVDDTTLAGGSVNWRGNLLSLSPGSAVVSGVSNTVTGPTNGVELSQIDEWLSFPVDQDFTMSGSIVVSLWAFESSMSANCKIAAIIEKVSGKTGVVTEVVRGADATELGTSVSSRTIVLTGYSPTVDFKVGDRIRVRIYIDDVGTMASGFTATFRYDQPSPGTDGYSSISFTEDIGFMVDTLGLDPTASSADAVTNLGDTSSNEALAICFAPVDSGVIASVDVRFRKFASPGDSVGCTLQRDDGTGQPDGVVLDTSTTVAGSSLSALFATTNFAFSGTTPVVAGTRYWLVFARTGAPDGVNFYAMGGTNGVIYDSWHSRKASGTWNSQRGNTYLGFEANMTHESTTLFLTDSAAAIDPGGGAVDSKEAWTSRGAGAVTKQTNDANGPTAPIQATNTLGGNTLEWYTRALQAFTLGGLVEVNLRARETVATTNATIRCEVAVVNNDGSGAVIWGAANDGIELGTAEAAMTFNIAGDAIAVTEGQRLRIRIFFDDMSGQGMANAGNLELFYAGTSGGASGDTFLKLGQTLMELLAIAGATRTFDPVPFMPTPLVRR